MPWLILQLEEIAPVTAVLGNTDDANLRLKFTETAQPRLINAPENSPGTGRFWVDVATGAIRQVELSMSTGNYLLRVIYLGGHIINRIRLAQF